MCKYTEELWVRNKSGIKYNLSEASQAKEWLKGLELANGKKIDTVTTNNGTTFSIDECPDELIVGFCQYIANNVGKVTPNGLTQ